LLKHGGIYAIEDMQTSYWPSFGGSEDPQVANTSISLIKQLIDGLNWEEYFHRQPEPYDKLVRSIHCYHNLVFIYKGNNEEGTNKNVEHTVLP
jgi:hypothetical protein